MCRSVGRGLAKIEPASSDTLIAFAAKPALPALIQGTLKHYDLGPILWGFMAEPPQDILNGLHPRLGKLVEIGSIYTAVAGLLNILAIYDAFEGPAYLDGDEPAAASSDSGSSSVSSRDGLRAGAGGPA